MRDLDQTIIKFDYDKNLKTDDFFLSKSNKHVFDFLNTWPKWERNFVNVTGENLSGKTHLMNIFLQKNKGFKLYGTNLDIDSCDYRDCDFTGPTAFVLGTEKWGLSEAATKLMDTAIYIPMRGMVQSLNVSVAASALLFEALRQREVSGTLPQNGEGLSTEIYEQILFEWCYPEVADWCKQEGKQYPQLNSQGEILEHIPRALKVRC